MTIGRGGKQHQKCIPLHSASSMLSCLQNLNQPSSSGGRVDQHVCSRDDACENICLPRRQQTPTSQPCAWGCCRSCSAAMRMLLIALGCRVSLLKSGMSAAIWSEACRHQRTVRKVSQQLLGSTAWLPIYMTVRGRAAVGKHTARRFAGAPVLRIACCTRQAVYCGVAVCVPLTRMSASIMRLADVARRCM